MKKFMQQNLLPLLALELGVLGALLRGILYAENNNDRGLLPLFAVAEVLLWAVTIFMLASLIWATRKLHRGTGYTFNYPPSILRAVATALSAVGFAVSSALVLFSGADTVAAVSSVFGILSGFVLVYLAFCRWKGIRPSALFPLIVCIFLIVRLVYCYRLWSSDPQLQNYLFPLLANVCAMLAAYHTAALTAGSGNRKLHTIFHLATAYFALASLPVCDDIVFYLSLMLWMFADLCNLSPAPKKQEKSE